MKVYTVNRGSDEDYEVVAIFSTKEKAREFMDTIPTTDYNEIEEFKLDSDAAQKVKKGHSLWHVRMLRDGIVERVERIKLLPYNFDGLGGLWRRTHLGKPDCLESRVIAASEEHAIKIANEKRTQLIAEGAWDE